MTSGQMESVLFYQCSTREIEKENVLVKQQKQKPDFKEGRVTGYWTNED